MIRLTATIIATLFIGAAYAAKPLKVYILAGQSNMEGHAKIHTIDYISEDPKTAGIHKAMVDTNGKYTVCENAWISYLTGNRGTNGTDHGKVTTGFGSRSVPTEPGEKIGPEFTFGIYMDKATEEPILLIKTAWGGKSLHTDFRSPSAGPYVFNESETTRLKSQGKLEQAQKDKAKQTGHYYRLMMGHVKKVLADPSQVCPAYDKKAGYELAGFVWFQAWNDMVDRGVYPNRDKPGGYDEYSERMAHFIRDVRKDLKAPKMKFVIGVVGVSGPLDTYTNEGHKTIHGNFRKAMAAPAALPEFKGNVMAVETAPFWDQNVEAIEQKTAKVNQFKHHLRTKNKNYANKDGKMSAADQKAAVEKYRAELITKEDEALMKRARSNAGYHYYGSAKTMSQIGKAFAEAMLVLEARQ